VAYSYRADVWCDDCGRAICERLKAEGKAPADPSNEWSFDSDDYPKRAGDDDESDSVTYGVRLQDDYATTYDNTWEDIPDDDLELLARVLKTTDEVGDDMLSSLAEQEQGCYVDNVWYTWDEIKHLWTDWKQA